MADKDPAKNDFGVDTLSPVSANVLAEVTKHFGGPPMFWGRYFHGPGDQGQKGQYDPAEGKILGDAGIRLLAIARQTTRVALDAKAGAADAKLNIDALKKAFGSVKDVYLFLDIEDEKKTHSPAMSAEYFTGWSNAIWDANILPCLYVRAASAGTFKALGDALDASDDTDYEMIWIARWEYGDHQPKPVPKTFNPMADYAKKIKDFANLVEKKYLVPDGDIALWQYMDGAQFDCDMINTKVRAELLKHLIKV
jgi:hypothetical protein